MLVEPWTSRFVAKNVDRAHHVITFLLELGTDSSRAHEGAVTTIVPATAVVLSLVRSMILCFNTELWGERRPYKASCFCHCDTQYRIKRKEKFFL